TARAGSTPRAAATAGAWRAISAASSARWKACPACGRPTSTRRSACRRRQTTRAPATCSWRRRLATCSRTRPRGTTSTHRRSIAAPTASGPTTTTTTRCSWPPAAASSAARRWAGSPAATSHRPLAPCSVSPRPPPRAAFSPRSWPEPPLAAAAPRLVVDGVDQRFQAKDLGAAFQALAEALGDPDRARVGRTDEADHALAPHGIEGVAQQQPRGLRRVALAPRLAPQQPAQLEAGPALGLEVAGPSQQRASGALLQRELPVPLEAPLAEHHRHLAPRRHPVDRLALADVAHDLLVGPHGDIGVEIVLAEHPQDHVLGLERDHRPAPEPHRRGITSGSRGRGGSDP